MVISLHCFFKNGKHRYFSMLKIKVSNWSSLAMETFNLSSDSGRKSTTTTTANSRKSATPQKKGTEVLMKSL